MSYGKHQSFYFRKSWASKGIRALLRDEKALFNQNSYLELGIGKNMQQSLRFWFESFQIIKNNNKVHEFTTFGKLVAKYDPGFSTTLTKNLLHFNLASGKYIDGEPSDSSNSIIWFFNKFKKHLFTKEDCLIQLKNYASNISENTLNRDVVCLLNTYTRKTPLSPEDRNISPLADLGLITKSNVDGAYYKTRMDYYYLSLDAIYFILLRFNSNGILTIDELSDNANNIGRVFNLTRLQIIEIIEKMIKDKYSLLLTRTSGIDIIKLTGENLDPFLFLEEAYKGAKL